MTGFDLALARIQTLGIDKLDTSDLVYHRLGFGITFIDTKHLFVVDEYLRWQALDDPRVHERVEGSDTLFGVPLQALGDEVVERVTLAHQDLVERLGARNA